MGRAGGYKTGGGVGVLGQVKFYPYKKRWAGGVQKNGYPVLKGGQQKFWTRNFPILYPPPCN